MSIKRRKLAQAMKTAVIYVLICILCMSGIKIFPPDFFCKEVMAEETEKEETTETVKSESTETAAEAKGPEITAPTAILMEAGTGRIIYEKNADESLPPASITKIMTLILIFEAIDAGQISLSDEVTVSEHAASMGGSQVFLEPGEVQTVDTMIKCIAVASANDACVAMAEFVAGTEELFVQKMNEKAQSLKMDKTHFVNCCGLDTEGHVSSARDIAIMSRELINEHPQIYDYSTIWMDTITHVTKRGSTEFGLTNTNKLIKQYAYATGLKTGSTSKAKCCLSATANKDGIELIAVIMVAPDSKTRFADARTLLNYGFGICKIYNDNEPAELADITLKGGKKNSVSVKYEKTFAYMFLEDFNADEIVKEPVIETELKAPVKEGDVVGQINYTYRGETIGKVNIVAQETVEKATFSDGLKKSIKRLCFV